MQVFKQKIGTFREACYLIFGYKVDMGEDKVGRCKSTLSNPR
jgi:mitotic spindle assembly checkpoint protein MAD1